MTGRSARLVAGAVLALLGGLLAWAPAAQAHVTVVGTTPAADATLDAAPERVEVRFDSALLDIGYALVVRSADDRTVSTGPVELGRTSISVDVDPDAGPGRYTVGFRVVSADGHEVTSSYAYTVAGDTPAPTPAPTPTDVEVQSDSPAPNPSEPQHRAGGASGSRWSPALVGLVAGVALAGAALLGWALVSRR